MEQASTTLTSSAIEADIASLNNVTTEELAARFKSITQTAPPEPMSRALLITAGAYVLVRQPHRMRARHVT